LHWNVSCKVAIPKKLQLEFYMMAVPSFISGVFCEFFFHKVKNKITKLDFVIQNSRLPVPKVNQAKLQVRYELVLSPYI
jgi:hypothetical protein